MLLSIKIFFENMKLILILIRNILPITLIITIDFDYNDFFQIISIKISGRNATIKKGGRIKQFEYYF